MMDFGNALIKVNDFILLSMFPFIGDVFNALFLREGWLDISVFPVMTAIFIYLMIIMPIIYFLYVGIFEVNYKEMIAEIDAELEEEGVEPIGAAQAFKDGFKWGYFGRADEKQEIDNAPWLLRLLRFVIIMLFKFMGSILLLIVLLYIITNWSYFGFK
ncbi:hypothetical protein N8Z63_08855 [Octadecabacter sp.]|nr:hypothetical protein [Octadecabacter sp.]